LGAKQGAKKDCGTGFSVFCPSGKRGESQKRKMGVGEAKEGNTCRQTPAF